MTQEMIQEVIQDMIKYRIDIMYDGTNYSGWQIQPNASSIQEVLSSAITTFTKETVSLVGSGRTDRGVHAHNQVAHVYLKNKVDTKTFMRALNGILPRDIRITSVTIVPSTFHAQQSAIKKEYHYYLCLTPFVPPWHENFCHHIMHAIDLTLLKEAASCFVGTHDFTSFSNKATTGACAKNPVRTIYRIDICPWEYGLRLEFEGNGFLYKMVRNIVGMLIQVASKKRSIDEIQTLFTEKDRRKAPMAAPARGLFLHAVTYRDDLT